ncbi:MAG TPA: hypothetical protein VFT84_00450 [Gemmatimonadales bacterium]|nr:hypothetical protein [Gemmatimonadales bacterium]
MLALLPAGRTAGVWLRRCPGLVALRSHGARRLLLSQDLGILLRRCHSIAVRHSGRPELFFASQLARCRLLAVVLGTPFLPPPAQLRALYPAMASEPGFYTIPIGLGSAEEALAICAAEHVAVRSTRIEYGLASS